MEWVWNKLVGFIRNHLLHLPSKKDTSKNLRFILFNRYIYNSGEPLGCTLGMPNSNFSPHCKMLRSHCLIKLRSLGQFSEKQSSDIAK